MAPLNHVIELPKLAYIEELLEERRVLLMGLDHGYVAATLAQRTQEVVVVDPSPVRVRYRQRRYPVENVSYQVAPLEATGLPDASFDVVIALAPPFGKDYARALLAELRRVLDPDGFLFLSLPTRHHPLRSHRRRSPASSPAELRTELRRFFPHVELLVQRAGLGVYIGDEREGLPTWRTQAEGSEVLTCEHLALCSRLLIMPEERLLADLPLQPHLEALRRQLDRRRRQVQSLSSQLAALQDEPTSIVPLGEDLAGLLDPVQTRDELPHLEALDRAALADGLDTLMRMVPDSGRGWQTSGAPLEPPPPPVDESSTAPAGPDEALDALEAELNRLREENTRLEAEGWRLEKEIRRLEAEAQDRQNELLRLEDEGLDLRIAVEESEGALEAAEKVRLELLEQLRVATCTLGEQARQIEALQAAGQQPAPEPVVAGPPEQLEAGAEPPPLGEALHRTRDLESRVSQLKEEAQARQEFYESALAREQLKSWMLEERLAAFQAFVENAGLTLPPELRESAMALASSDDLLPFPQPLELRDFDELMVPETSTVGAPPSAVAPVLEAAPKEFAPAAESATPDTGETRRQESEPAPAVEQSPGGMAAARALEPVETVLAERTAAPAGTPATSPVEEPTGVDDPLEPVISSPLPSSQRWLPDMDDELESVRETPLPADLPPTPRETPAETETLFDGGLDDVVIEPPLPTASRRLKDALAAQFRAPDQTVTEAPAYEPDADEGRPPEEDTPLPPIPKPDLEAQRALLDDWDKPRIDPEEEGEEKDEPTVSYLLEEARAKEAPSERTGELSAGRLAPLLREPGAVSYPAAPSRGGMAPDLPQRGEMALLEALEAKNLDKLPNVTLHVEDEVERALLDEPIEAALQNRFRALQSVPPRLAPLVEATVRRETLRRSDPGPGHADEPVAPPPAMNGQRRPEGAGMKPSAPAPAPVAAENSAPEPASSAAPEMTASSSIAPEAAAPALPSSQLELEAAPASANEGFIGRLFSRLRR